MKRATIALLALALSLGCSSTPSSSQPPAETGLSACLEQPGELPRVPDGHLPCDLIPPGLSL
ncbi:MAG TPA: hypothetical protein VJV79_21750 [Polyangiaceae bacterium]|nr:hypothetical protein [Polyangiaceae bacterium]